MIIVPGFAWRTQWTGSEGLTISMNGDWPTMAKGTKLVTGS
jgi:hypothetical protein